MAQFVLKINMGNDGMKDDLDIANAPLVPEMAYDHEGE